MNFAQIRQIGARAVARDTNSVPTNTAPKPGKPEVTPGNGIEAELPFGGDASYTMDDTQKERSKHFPR